MRSLPAPARRAGADAGRRRQLSAGTARGDLLAPLLLSAGAAAGATAGTARERGRGFRRVQGRHLGCIPFSFFPFPFLL